MRNRSHGPTAGTWRIRRLLALVAAGASLLLATAPVLAASWGPATPNFNEEVILKPVDDAGAGFGLVTFRQPKDADKIVYLGTWVRDLAPNTEYSLQRATDMTVNDVCTGTNWLTLGQGSTPHSITTDETGTGRADLYRSLAAIALGSKFDIKFRVIETATSAVVLQGACYQFIVSL